MSRSDFILQLEPVFFGLSNIIPPDNGRYDLIASRTNKTASLVLTNILTNSQDVIIKSQPVDSFLKEFRTWYKENLKSK